MSQRDRSPVDRVKYINLHIGNIPFSKTWNDLKDIIKKECGIVGFVDVAMKDGKSAGFGRMGLRNRQDALTVIDKANGMDIDGRKIMIRFETENDRRKWPLEEFDDDGPFIPPPYITPDMLESIGFKGPITDSVFVNNVAESATWKALREKFDGAGPVQFVDLLKAKKSDKFYFALARFRYGFEALLCIAMFDRDIFFGREIRIRMDKQGKELNPNEPIFPNSKLGSLAASQFLSEMNRRISSRDPLEANFASKVVSIFMSQMRRPSPPMPLLPSGNSPRMMPPVPSRRPLPQDDFYERDRYGPPGDLMRMRHLDPLDFDDRRAPRRPSYPPVRPVDDMPPIRPLMAEARGYSPEQMQRSIAYYSPPAQRKSEKKASAAIVKLISAAIQGGISPEELKTYAKELDVSEKELEEIKRNTKSNTDKTSARILVRNLPFEFNEREMDVYFTPYGRIKDLSITKDGQGRSLGYGYVEYFLSKDASVALNRLNGIRIGENTIKLDYD